jgi:hypothetical protein
LPEVSYTPFDPTPTIEAVHEARCRIVPVTTVDLWRERQAQSIEQAARMLAAVGTSGLFEHGRLLYVEPSAPLRYLPAKPLELAHQVQETMAQLSRIHLDIAPPAYHSAVEVAERLEVAVKEHFGDQAPRIDLVDQLSDPRQLLAMLTFMVVANRLDIEPLLGVVTILLDSAPVVRMPSAS